MLSAPCVSSLLSLPRTFSVLNHWHNLCCCCFCCRDLQGAVEEVTNGFIMLCSWVGMVAFALCYERGRRWARGMGSMWPAGNTPQGRWRCVYRHVEAWWSRRPRIFLQAAPNPQHRVLCVDLRQAWTVCLLWMLRSLLQCLLLCLPDGKLQPCGVGAPPVAMERPVLQLEPRDCLHEQAHSAAKA